MKLPGTQFFTPNVRAKTREGVIAEYERLRDMSSASPADLALIMAAPAHQASLSLVGYAIAQALGVRGMPNLHEVDELAREKGLDPAELWPHMKINKRR